MKVKTILSKAKSAKSESEVEALLNVLENSFTKNRSLSNLYVCNREPYLDNDEVYVRFELNRVISEEYITMIRVEIRDGAMVIEVVTNRMLDGMGMSSQRWEIVEGLEEQFEAEEDRTIADLAKRVTELAIFHHARLIESVGVKFSEAPKVAKRSW